MNENDVLFQKVTQAYSEKNPSAPIRSMPVSLSGIIHHSHSFTRLENVPSHLFNCQSSLRIIHSYLEITGQTHEKLTSICFLL